MVQSESDSSLVPYFSKAVLPASTYTKLLSKMPAAWL